MPKIHAINVRALAEFALQKGDLMPASQQMESMNDGNLGHRQLQSLLGEGWKAEVYVSRQETVGGVTLRVQGRPSPCADPPAQTARR